MPSKPASSCSTVLLAHGSVGVRIGNSMISSNLGKKHTSEFFKDHQRCMSPKDKCMFFFKFEENSRVHVFSHCMRNHAITYT